MKREELKSKFVQINIDIEQMQAVKFKYITDNFYFPGIGIISTLDNNEIIRAYSLIKKEKDAISSSAEELGLSVETNDDNTDYGDFKIDDILTDIKTRASEIKHLDNLNKKILTSEILKKHLSEDDLFELDMEQLNKLGTI